MDHIRHYSAALGLLAGIVALGLPWLTFELSSGVTGAVTWGDVSAGSVSLSVASACAWALTLLVSPMWRRILGVSVALMGSVAIGFALASLGRTPEIVLSRAESEAGVIGAFSLDDVAWTWSVAGPTLSFVAMGALLLTGVALMVWPGGKRKKDPYQREIADPWEQLSRGGDPTER
jgi:hypothetical protein